jgi:hypothetical protein
VHRMCFGRAEVGDGYETVEYLHLCSWVLWIIPL